MNVNRIISACAVGLACGACAGIQSGPAGGLLDVGRAVAKAKMPIGVPAEIEIGRGIAATVAGRYGMLPDTALNMYVDLVGQVVAQQSPRATELAYRFGVLDTDDVNAFAAPGGYIFVTRGALSLMRSEAELAAVLAHEVGHVDAKHVLEQIQKADVLAGIQDQTGLTALQQGGGLPGMLVDKLASAGASRLFTGLAVGDELEADSLGQVYAAAAGYRADGLVQFLTHLRQVEQSADTSVAADGGAARAPRRRLFARVREMRRTHPPTDARLAALQRQMTAAGLDPAAGVAVEDRFRARAGRVTTPDPAKDEAPRRRGG